MILFRYTFLSLIALMICLPVAAQENESRTEKLFLNVTLGAQGLYFDGAGMKENDPGGSISLRAGWGFTELFTLYLSLNGAQMNGGGNPFVGDDYEWGALELGGRFNFRSGKKLVPFADAALRAVAVVREDIDLEYLGGGITLGGGASYYLTPAVALEVGLRLGWGGFNEVEQGTVMLALDPDDFGYAESRLSFGLVFYPFR